MPECDTNFFELGASRADPSREQLEWRTRELESLEPIVRLRNIMKLGGSKLQSASRSLARLTN